MLRIKFSIVYSGAVAALALFQTWRQKDYDTLKLEQAEIATREAQVQLEEWKNGTESTIRDAASFSMIQPKKEVLAKW